MLEAWAEIQRRFARPKVAAIQPDKRHILLRFAQPVDLDHLVLWEDLREGQHIDGFELLDEQGQTLAAGRTIGHKRILPFPRRQVELLTLRLERPGGRLSRVEAHRTGHESLPVRGVKLDYQKWAKKADRKAEA
ncbi:hypothetical protein ACERK3_01730 [Phycisphaerales bacterium AB-hyl4]|uniref:Uncharacterized protein n=1 Tax=Natronomicrosphaera hydrolytica TaxID=3242702 RepID=A0ABV4U078_9BACT